MGGISVGDVSAVVTAVEAVETETGLTTTAVETVETALAAPTLIAKSQTSGDVASASGKLYYVVWSGPGGGPEPRIQLSDDVSTFFDTYSELKVCVVLSPAIPIPFVGKLTVVTDARTANFGYTLD